MTFDFASDERPPHSPLPTAEVTFLPDGKTVRVPVGTTVQDAAGSAGVFIDGLCGKRGVCGRCRVRATGSLSGPTTAETAFHNRHSLDSGWRLACQATITGDCTISIPGGDLQIAIEGIEREVAFRPNARKAHVILPPTSIAEATSALSRLRSALAVPRLDVGASALRSLAHAIRAGDGLTAAMVGCECVHIEPGDTTDRVYGLAFDIGTTTVVGSIIDLSTGNELAVAAGLNEQALYGGDIISRIKLVGEDPGGLLKLNQQIIGVLNRLIDRLVRESQVARSDIYEITIVGNTCMHHLALGLDPSSLGQAPYAAVVQDALTIPAVDIGLSLSPGARVFLLPIIAGHVGADAVAVALAAGLHQTDEIRLAVDIGTNGESILGSRDRLVACSNAAGPAFEGGSIRYGMRATAGAIERVEIDADVEISVIGNTQPSGICGSGLIDAIAALCQAGMVDSSGRLVGLEDAPPHMPQALLDRLISIDGERAFRLSPPSGQLVALGQRDIRELQLAKGAIFAGIRVLCDELGVSDDEITEVCLAGAFGNYIRPSSARTIGLIPNLPLDRVRSIGNAARVGARLALVSTEARAEAVMIARSVQHQELFARDEFMDQFMEAMTFPDISS